MQDEGLMYRREKPGEGLHIGHRERMRNKFISHGSRVFENYELLEMLLYPLLRCKDTNPPAKRLFKRFSSLDGILSASPSELVTVDGVGEGAAELISRVGDLRKYISPRISVAKAAIGDRSILITRGQNKDGTSDSHIGMDCECDDPLGREKAGFDPNDTAEDIFVRHFSGSFEYKVSFLMLDNALKLIGIFDLCNADYASAAVKPREVIDLVLESKASFVIIGHNHPYGPLMPTPGDLQSNRMVLDALNCIGVYCIEHYVVSGDRAIGMLKENRERFHGYKHMRHFLGVRPDPNAPKEEPLGVVCDAAVKDVLFGEITGILAFAMEKTSAELFAKALLQKYKSLTGILKASVNELSDIIGLGISEAVFLKTVAAILSRCEVDKLRLGKRYTNEEVAIFCISLFLDYSSEAVSILLKNSKGDIFAVRHVCDGALNAVGLTPRQIVEIAAENHASAVVLTHNHPSGSPEPSADDLVTTEQLKRVLDLAGISLDAHYIVSEEKCTVLDLTFDCQE